MPRNYQLLLRFKPEVQEELERRSQILGLTKQQIVYAMVEHCINNYNVRNVGVVLEPNEMERIIEMLCCVEKELLLDRLVNKPNLPAWLERVDTETVQLALEVYDDEKYVYMRKESVKL